MKQNTVKTLHFPLQNTKALLLKTEKKQPLFAGAPQTFCVRNETISFPL